MTMRRLALVAGVLVLTVASGLARPPHAQTPSSVQAQPGQPQGQGGRGQPPPQPRDQAQAPQGKASISGRVLAADTGRPVKRARVTVSGGGRGGRATTTDDQGRYQLTDLSAGSYTITGSKNGFVDGAYGQRRPRQPGTPVELAEAQAAANVDLRLTRGGVITGRVLDEDGDPLARALVTVQRYQFVRGERQLSPAGGDQTDDRGEYRVFGLAAGDYYVSATAAGLGQLIGRGLRQLAAGGAAGGGRGGPGGPGGLGGDFPALGAVENAEPTGYAPTYYPGVVNAPDAGKITVAPGQEVVGIDFQIQLVPLATVTGIVAGADDVVPVMLMPQDAGGMGPLGMVTGRSQADGTFAIANVPPGRYVAVARSGGRRNNDSKSGMQPIVVNGQNIDGVSLILQPGVTISGNITVESAGTQAPTDYSGFRVDAPDVAPLPFGAGPGGGRGGAGGERAQKNGAFAVGDLIPGKHYIRVTGGAPAAAQGRGQGSAQVQWTLKSVIVAGQEVSDQPVDLKPGQNLDNVTVVLTDRTTEISGTVRDGRSEPLNGFTVIVFSSEPQFWGAQSRHIRATRTDTAGTFRVSGMPPGDYLAVAVDAVEQGEWFDPAYLEQIRPGARQITINEGEKKTQDLRGPS